MYFSLAAAQGHPQSAERRDAGAKDMTLWQIAEADRLVADWKPRTEPDSA